MWIATLVAAVFAALALLHAYWAAGGQWGSDAALPRVPAPGSGADASQPMVRAFSPGPGATLAVAATLALVAVLVVLRAGLLGWRIEHEALRWAIAGVAAAMLLRAIGDFRLVGFFKRVNGSRFARLDSLLFSPLCLALGLGLALVAA